MAWMGTSCSPFLPVHKSGFIKEGQEVAGSKKCTLHHSFQAVKILAVGCCECQKVYMAVEVRGGGLDKFVEYKSW